MNPATTRSTFRNFFTVLALLTVSRHVWAAVAVSAAFWLIAHYSDFLTMNYILRAIQLWIAAAVAIAYGARALPALTQRKLDKVEQLITGIALLSSGAVMQCVVVIYYRLAHPGEPAFSQWGNYATLIMVVGAIMHITAPEVLSDRVPRMPWIVVGVAVGGGLALGWTLLAISAGGM